MKKKMIGIETELFVMKDGRPIINPYVNMRDSFPLLSEVRGMPSDNKEDTYFNWLKEYKIFCKNMNKMGFYTQSGEMEITPEEYQNSVKQMNRDEQKVLPSNIYGHKHYSNMKIKDDGEITGYTIYSGLHIHFSYIMEIKYGYEPEFEYEPTTLSFTGKVGKNLEPNIYLNLYERKPNFKRGESKSATENMLSDWLIETIVKELDENLFGKYNGEARNKYRQPGFYEVKEDGRFEYRSLPFNEGTEVAMENIVDTCWDILDKI